MKALVIVALLSFQMESFGQASNPSTMDSTSIINLLKASSRKWIGDSTASNGFRDFLSLNNIYPCKCLLGLRWKSISRYLGKPNYYIDKGKFLEEGTVIYRYMTYSAFGGKDVSELGSRRLDIYVKNGIITEVYIFELDG
ncbi:MAG: hypothetical protein JWP69_1433 [Flaviaesturariibacter sp.]|nr:hypothetical protein [Flaviaesturariibacter sp.]